METDSAHKRNWEIGEVVFGVPFLLGVALNFIVPFALPHGTLRQALIPIGILLILLGLYLIVLARREFARYNQPTDPGQPTSTVIKSGVFAISRNPLYLGAVLIFLGISLAINNLWTLVTLLISIMLCHYVLIVPEEKYLAAKFGKAYQDYTAIVQRWLGHK